MTDELTGFSGRRRRRRQDKVPGPDSQEVEGTTQNLESGTQEPTVPETDPVRVLVGREDISKTPDHEILSRPIAPFLTKETIRKIQTAIDAAQNAGDYRYKSVPGVVREAIFVFLDDRLRLSAKPKPGPKKRIHILMKPSDYERYEAQFRDFDRKRSEVIERAALAFLLNGFDGDK